MRATMFDSDAQPPVRVAADRRRADEWALALLSAGIDVRIGDASGAAALYVRAEDRRRAEDVLAAYDAENPPIKKADLAAPANSYAAYVIAALLAGFFAVTGPRDAGRLWFARGAADASRIAAGELWRTVTALTLHADGVHILGNVVVLLIFGSSLCGVIGAGTGIWLMLLAGVFGNAAAAALHPAPYSSVGASTSIFGAIGALAMIQLVRHRRGLAVSRWRAWMPVAAGVALLGFLGTAREADVVAHLFGFIAGLLLAVPAMRAVALRDRIGVQAALSTAAAGVVAGCWIRAMR